MRVFDEKDPGEIVPVSFDFSADVATGATVTLISVSVSVVDGADPAPANILAGAATASGATVVQWITGGLDATRYKLRCRVAASDGQTLVLPAIVPVRTQ